MSSYCGYIALVGRPNVGKSTLLNRLVAQKISITSNKPQTTRHRILGVNTINEFQFIYVDTPGIHLGAKKMLNRVLNKTARNALQGVNIIIFIIDSLHWTAEDEHVLCLIKKLANIPCILLINKVDKLTNKLSLLPWLEKLNNFFNFVAIISASAKTGMQIDVLQQELKKLLLPGPHEFATDICTDRSLIFLCTEILREKIFRFCGQELPYSTAIAIESYQDNGQRILINALILVNKVNHKQMIIGKQGKKLKEIASKARLEMEKIIGKPVYLQSFCKVKPQWIDDQQQLQQLGYGD